VQVGTVAMDEARPALPEPISEAGVVAIGRRPDPASVLPIAHALVEGGVRAFEITLDSEAALDAVASLSRAFDDGSLLIGAGTVMDVEAAGRALEAGASFLVTPHLDVEVVRFAAARGIAILPGAFSPTEILAAWRAGAAAVKLFPASAAGPAFVRELRGPFRDIPLVPTGGVTIDDIAPFITAGAAAVGMGSWLTGGGDPATVRERARQAVDTVRVARRTA
jgi:2-dehydro-3-deoxyphosphogluconate aldolase/(4S)-4-hydroxy-2-oxoglutarate aldolase